jgi:hypothetical protein
MKKKLMAFTRIASVLAASSMMVTIGNLASTSRPASADPGFVGSYVGVGSDTTQDIFDAYTGADPYPGATNAVASNFFTPLNAGTASFSKVISSFDAVPAGQTAPGCITAKIGGAAFDRPNGSTDGINALSHAVDGTPWSKAGTCAGSAGNVGGQIDFARSSRDKCATPGVGTCPAAGTALTFIPFARDAVSFAFWDHGGTAINNITVAQLQALYGPGSTGSITVGTKTVHACMVQTGSGTGKFFVGAIGGAVTEATAHSAATAASCDNQEENGANQFFTTASTNWPTATLPNDDAIIPFSAGSWISQFNPATALDRSATGRTNGVDLGSPDTTANPGVFLPKPYTVSGTTESPNAAYYGDTQWGRNLFVVVPTAKISGLRRDTGLVALFAGSTAAICQTAAQNTAHQFGFDSLTAAQGTCGATTDQAALYS